MQNIVLNGFTKQYQNKHIFEDFNHTFVANKITVLFGPNGCGKSTLLKAISGRDTDYSGRVTGTPEHMSYMFQQYKDSLLPWYSVRDNMLFPLTLQNMTVRQQNKKLDEVLVDSPIAEYIYKYPYQLSGGQQQMVVLLRALITEPELLLLDEPFSAMDYQYSLQMREKLSAYQASHDCTTICISHDIEEAVFLADTILVLGGAPSDVQAMFRHQTRHPRQNTLSVSRTAEKLEAEVLDAFLIAVKDTT